jgi:secondary thiamine-phosphate synthase enzyme
MVVTKNITLKSRGETDIINVTPQVEEALSKSKLKNGIATVFVTGATGGITTLEYESGLISDLKDAFEKWAPRRGEYAHNSRWGDGNGFSHVRASLLGPSLTVPFSGGRLTLGTWQQIIFIDFDNRPRSRKLVVQVVGE